MPRLPALLGLLLLVATPLALEAQPLVQDPPRGNSALARAVRITTPPVVDGILDEAIWATIEPIRDFVQRDPVDGGVPSEATEVRIAYDDQALYFAFYLYDSDPSAIRSQILHRGGNIALDDHVVIGLDTFADRRNGYIFEINALGTQDDAIFTDESISRDDWSWDGVYESETSRTELGWTLEVAIPFTTLRFPREDVLEMGILFFRSIRRKNETVYWPQLPATYRGRYAQASQYGTLVGLEGIRPGRNLQVKPFLLAGAQKGGSTSPSNRVTDLGVDVKYSLTSSLTLDLTWNTDFAQVEADNVQVNLDRFSLFFPEKREFFLERSGLFAFGDAGESQLFFSRRIGLGTPILGGGRLTGQVGRFTVGLLALQTEDEGEAEGGSNLVARVRVDPAPRISLGGMITGLRQGEGWRQGGGLDAQVRFFGSSSLDLWGAGLNDPILEAALPEGSREGAGPMGGLGAGSANLRLRNATYGAALGFTSLGRHYQPALGFVRRADLRRLSGELNFTPRFEGSAWARQFNSTLGFEEVEGQDRIFQSGRRNLDLRFTFESGEEIGTSLNRREERLLTPFRIRPGVVIPDGSYTFSTTSVSGRTNGSRPLSANGSASIGDFYGGTRREVRLGLSYAHSPRLTLSPGFSQNVVSFPVAWGGGFTTRVADLTVKAAVNRKVFGDVLLQYDDASRRVQTNLRVNWIHSPGSNLFLVLDTGVFTGELLEPNRSRWERRTGVIKLTYLKAL